MASVTDRPSNEQLCEQIKALVPVSDYVRTLPELRLRNLSFRCPNASAHKHGDKNPSAAINHTQRSWNCKACGAWGSVIDIYRYYYQVSSSEAIRAMADYAGLTPAYGAVSKPAPVRPAITPKPDETPIVPAGPEVQRFLVNAQAAFREHPGAQAYVVETRGIPLEVAIAAGMGYAPRGAWLNWWGSRQPRVIVPLTTPDGTLINLYGRSTVNCDKALKHSFLPGSRGIFNAPALATEGVVLVEGVFDALTVLATHHPAAAIMGLSIRNQWWTEIGARVLLLAADDDEPGRKRQAAIAEAGANLARKVIYCPKPNYLGGRKDFNDFWLHVERRLPKSLDTFYEKKLPAKLAELAAQTAAQTAPPSPAPAECPAAA